MDPMLYRAASDARLDASQRQQLYRLAMAPAEPALLARRLNQGLLLVAALLLAGGLIFWIAANWQEQTRMFKLGLIEAALALSVVAAAALPRARVPALLAANLVLGGLLAFVGQTYQTGADAWQLFAAWATLSLVWTGLARSDVLWTLWIGICAAGLLSWEGRLGGWFDMLQLPSSAPAQGLRMGLWLALAVVPGLVASLAGLRLAQGLGRGSHRLALGLALAAWCIDGTAGLFDAPSGAGLFAVACALVAAVWLLSRNAGRWQDFASLCLATVAANALLMAAALRVAAGSDLVGLLLIGLIVGVGGLGGSVAGLLSVQRRMAAEAMAANKEQVA